ncbi:MAG: patatin-like phospholipase family protein [Gammaproteobacteria bacterium]
MKPAILFKALVILPLVLAPFSPGKAVAAPDKHQRPSIGLALSGGGARGSAHLGVLRLLEEMNIPVDYIAGTSMGSIIGGLYASGMSVDEIEQALTDIHWEDIFSDLQPREERRFRRKMDDYLYLVRYRVGVNEQKGEVNLAPALIQGQKFDLILRKYLLPVANIDNFDRLRIPFRAVATDIVRGKAAVLGSGDLPTAIRASMAVPAVFAPVELNDKLLVDGGIAMNLPVSVVREMGADIVIAVDISTPGLERDQIKSALDMLNQLSALLTRRDTELQIASLTTRDVLIVPALGERVTSADFKPEKLLEGVAIGYAGASAHRAELSRLAVSAPLYATYRKSIAPPSRTRPTIDYVHVENESRLSDEVLSSRVTVKPGEPLDPEQLEEDVGRIYGLDNFESVRYRVEERNGETGVIISAKQKSWGTSSLQLGLELSSTSTGNSFFNLGTAFTMMPMNKYNGEWRTFAQIGEEPLLFTEFYQPLDPDESWYVNVGAGWINRDVSIYEGYSANAALAEYTIDSSGLRLAGGRNLGNWGRISLAYERYTGDASLSAGTAPMESFDFDIGELELRLAVDTLDNVTFPSQGWRGFAYGRVSRTDLGADSDFEQYGFSAMRAGSMGRHLFSALAYFETTPNDDAPVESLFSLGGFARLSGYSENQLSGQSAGLLRGTYMYDLDTSFVSTYVGGTAEFGGVWQQQDDISLDDSILAGSLFVGVDTVVGPVFLGYGHAEGGNSGIYLFLGRPWFRF